MSVIVKRVDWTPGSGIATLVVDENGTERELHGDAGPMLRAVEAAGLKVGDEISYHLTNFGTLAYFEKEDDNA